MPIKEHGCNNESCSRYGQAEEHFYHHWDSQIPNCLECGQPEVLYISQFAVCWSSDFGKYVDKKVAGHEEFSHNNGAHWAFRKTNLKEGEKPYPVLIDSFQKQREYCKAEGLALPSEWNNEVSTDENGRGLTGRGMPGQWH